MSENSPPNAEKQQSISITKLCLIGWNELFRSRERILRQVYQNTSRMHDLNLPPSASLAESRQFVSERLPKQNFVGEFAIDTMESRLVLAERIMAIWQVLWLSILPLIIAAWFAIRRISSMSSPTALGVVITLALAIVFLFCSSLCGALILSFAQKRFVAAINKFLKAPEISKAPQQLADEVD